MKLQENKCVMILDGNLPLGNVTNTAAILGATLGKQVPEIVGNEVVDNDKQRHLGIVTIPIPILRSNALDLSILREKLYHDDFSELIVVDFTDVAQHCATYQEYIQTLHEVDTSSIHYMGIALYGPKKKINALTGSMPLLR